MLWQREHHQNKKLSPKEKNCAVGYFPLIISALFNANVQAPYLCHHTW
jgi:hypothetical protein